MADTSKSSFSASLPSSKRAALVKTQLVQLRSTSTWMTLLPAAVAASLLPRRVFSLSKVGPLSEDSGSSGTWHQVRRSFSPFPARSCSTCPRSSLVHSRCRSLCFCCRDVDSRNPKEDFDCEDPLDRISTVTLVLLAAR